MKTVFTAFMVVLVLGGLAMAVFAAASDGMKPQPAPHSGLPMGVQVFYLEDGTRCVEGYNVGLTCDWRQAVKQ